MKKKEPDEPRPLRPTQARFIDAYLTLGDVPAAARFVGIDRSTGWRWLQLPEIRDELAGRMREQTRRMQMALFEREAAAFAAVDTLLVSADEKMKLRAATWVLDHALKLGADAKPAKSLAELQLEELEREAAAELAGLRDIAREAS
jgi:hypothetical protein